MEHPSGLGVIFMLPKCVSEIAIARTTWLAHSEMPPADRLCLISHCRTLEFEAIEDTTCLEHRSI